MSASEPGRSILVVDDDDAFRARLERALAERGFEVRAAATAAEAIRLAAEDPPELAVVDLRLPDARGLEVVKTLKSLDEATEIVLLTGYGSIATAVEGLRLGAVHYLTKPIDVDGILAAFEGGASTPVPITAPSLARVEWEHIQRVLNDCQGNVSKAARVLGIHRRSLQRKLEKYPVRR